jgi:hypothetical protein
MGVEGDEQPRAEGQHMLREELNGRPHVCSQAVAALRDSCCQRVPRGCMSWGSRHTLRGAAAAPHTAPRRHAAPRRVALAGGSLRECRGPPVPRSEGCCQAHQHTHTCSTKQPALSAPRAPCDFTGRGGWSPGGSPSGTGSVGDARPASCSDGRASPPAHQPCQSPSANWAPQHQLRHCRGCGR